MPLLGGPSEKYGNRYEGKWIARCLTELLAEEVEVVRLEPPGEEGEGCELWLKRRGIIEHHQVKRQHSLQQGWTIPELGRRGVLRTAFEKTTKSDSKFVFASSVSAGGLEELIEPARQGVSLSEFKREYLKGSRGQAWKDLLREWRLQLTAALGGGSKQDIADEPCEALAYERLQRIEVRTMDEISLGEWVETKCRTLSTKNPRETFGAIIVYASEHPTAEIHANTLWEYLSSLGHRRTLYSKEKSVIEAVNAQNQRYMRLLDPIQGAAWIDRGEVDEALQYLEGYGNKRAVLISGQAGVGKSVALGQIIRRIREKEYPHLYFRIDRLDPEKLPERIGTQMGLPAPPVEILAGLADGRTCVLVIDQLDAVSMVSGRNPEFFDCIHEIIRKVEVFPNMRLIMACREFDLDKDNRLRELVAEKGIAKEVKIGLLAQNSVRQVLDCNGIDGKACPDHQVELMRLPLNMKVYLEVMAGRKGVPRLVTSVVSLFDAFWAMKRTSVSERIKPKEVKWEAVVDALIDRMMQKQALFAPATALDACAETAKAMVSEGVLAEDDQRVGFFHEAFFDYCFARRFLGKGDDLLAFLKSGEQHLFKRAPLRQVLVHLHESDRPEFIRQVKAILEDHGIRYHIKTAVLDTLKRLGSPCDRLWQLFAALLTSPARELALGVQGVLSDNREWFRFLHEKGVIKEWLASDVGDVRGIAQRMISANINAFPDETADLLMPYVGMSPEWNRMIMLAMWGGERTCSRAVFDLFLQLVSRKMLASDGEEHEFWMCLHGLPDKHPEWAVEAVGLHLAQELEGIDSEGISRGSLRHDQSGVHLIVQIAERAPQAYLNDILPLMITTVEKTAREREDKLLYGDVWGARSFGDEPMSMEEAILAGCEKALRIIASSAPDDFIRVVDQLRPYGDYDSINYLMIRGFAVAAQPGADLAVEYILANPQRMECGWGVSSGGDVSFWAARECIEHVSPMCSMPLLKRLCDVAVDYFPKWERTKGGYKSRGYWQMVILPVIDPMRRTPNVTARIGEWMRKNPGWSITPPKSLSSQFEGAPIPDCAIGRMSDEQWIGAMRAYNMERESRPGRLFKGGACQLYQELRKATIRNPNRFAALACRFDSHVQSTYFDEILIGLSESNAESSAVYSVVRHFFSLPDKPGSRWICRPIKKFSQEMIPDDILGMIGWLATEATDPVVDRPFGRKSNGNGKSGSDDLLSAAINSTRGTAAEVLETLIFDDLGRASYFLPYLERMICDPVVAVRTTVAAALLGLYRHNESRAVDLFIKLCDTPRDDLLATFYADRFLYYANYRHHDRLRPILERMICSEIKEVKEAGAKHYALAQFRHISARPEANQCLDGDESLRLGVARVAEANLFQADCVEFCHPVLERLFNDPSKRVRDEAASAFRRAQNKDLGTCRGLLRVFIKSAAFAENVEDLTRAMKASTINMDDEILAVGDAVACALEAGMANSRGRLYLEGEIISDLVLRTYRQSNDPAFQSQCLDLIDRLIKVEAYGISKELEAFER